MIRDLIAGGLDVLALTSSPQVGNVFAVARRLGLERALGHALRGS